MLPTSLLRLRVRVWCASCAAPYAFAALILAACSSEPVLNGGDPNTTGSRDGGPDAHTSEGGDGDGDDKGDGDAGADKGPDPVTLEQCTTQSSGLSAERLEKLRAGGAAGDMRFIYPYDGTIFPRGLRAPVLMWQAASAEMADAVHVHIKSSWFEYTGCMKPDASGRVALPQDVWDEAARQTLGKSDPFTVELTAIRGSEVKGPISEKVVIAPGSLRGSVFYNSYSSPLAKKQGAPGGAILRIPGGGEAEVFLGQDGCVGCHSVSAQGNRMVAAAYDFPETQGVYKLLPDGPVNPPPIRGNQLDHVGVSPDGAVYAVAGQLFETDTGITVTDSGLPVGASQANFSPDGKWVTFLDYDQVTSASALAVMSWDATTRKCADYRKLLDFEYDGVTGHARFMQWPTFLPDSKAVMFLEQNSAELYLVDLATSKVTILARAMGYDTPELAADPAGDKTYLPFGAAELRQSFYPTIAPVAAGGYFWAFFDTSRKYGNFDTTKIEPGVEQPQFPLDPICQILPFLCPTPAPVDPQPVPTGVPSRQLWVTAIEIAPDGSYAHDPSAPAFYLPGQEIGANNHRAFAALDPCLVKGASCESGTECCDGFCTDGMCSMPEERCSKTEEACKSAADCCDHLEQCISGFCTFVLF